MATVEERVKVLKMIEDGKVSAEEGTRLLAALDKSRQRGQRGGRGAPPVEGNGRWMRLRVSDTRSGKTKVNMQLPLGLVNMGLQLGARFVPEIDSLDAGQIQNALRSGTRGKILEVTSDSGELVEIYVE
ncbi:MAG: hypothetical protein KF893_04305 [Caldilineaceae bacterium]|nr:hypothetical protein [Caldilineaceae bacterium]